MKKIVSAICIVALLATSFSVYALMSSSNPTKWPTKEVTRTEENALMGVKTFKWNGIAVNCQFSGIVFDDKTYVSTDVSLPTNILSKDYGEIALETYDMCADQSLATVGNIHDLKNIDKEKGIAVKLQGDDRYFLYINIDYEPETLGDLIDYFDISDNISFLSTIYYYAADDGQEYQIQFENPSADKILELLSKTYDKPVSQLPETSKDLIQIDIKLDWADEDDFKVVFTDDGFACVTMFGDVYYYDIGVEAISEFETYLTEDVEGYQLIFTNTL